MRQPRYHKIDGGTGEFRLLYNLCSSRHCCWVASRHDDGSDNFSLAVMVNDWILSCDVLFAKFEFFSVVWDTWGFMGHTRLIVVNIIMLCPHHLLTNLPFLQFISRPRQQQQQQQYNVGSTTRRLRIGHRRLVVDLTRKGRSC
jgi:hypothetical protein